MQGRPAPTPSLDYFNVSSCSKWMVMKCTHGSGAGVGAADDVLLAALIEDVLDRKGDDGDCIMISIEVKEMAIEYSLL